MLAILLPKVVLCWKVIDFSYLKWKKMRKVLYSKEWDFDGWIQAEIA